MKLYLGLNFILGAAILVALVVGCFITFDLSPFARFYESLLNSTDHQRFIFLGVQLLLLIISIIEG